MKAIQLAGMLTVVGVLFLTAVYVEVLGAPGFSGDPVRDSHRLTIQISMPADTATGDAGSPCQPAGGITAGAQPQLLITDDTQRTISVVDLAGGTHERQADLLGCRVDAQTSILDSRFYTFTIEGAYRQTMARETLEADDWTIAIASS